MRYIISLFYVVVCVFMIYFQRKSVSILRERNKRKYHQSSYFLAFLSLSLSRRRRRHTHTLPLTHSPLSLRKFLPKKKIKIKYFFCQMSEKEKREEEETSPEEKLFEFLKQWPFMLSDFHSIVKQLQRRYVRSRITTP